MPSSKARRRRAQQRRAAGAQTQSRRPATVEQPAERAPVEPVEDSQPDLAETVEAPVGDQPQAEAIDTVEIDGADESEDLDGADEEETLEEQEADVEAAVAEAERGGGFGAPRGRSGATALAEPARPAVRSGSRKRRRGAAPQPQGPAVLRFFKETFDELRKVDWPTPQELYRYTIIVIITVIVLAAFISGIDWALQHLAERFVYGSNTATTG